MSIIRQAAKVGGFTTLSRILGFLRDQLIAFTLGTGDVADAFFVAQRFPNLFRTLFAEGAFNAAFVPIFAQKVEGEGKRAALVMARQVYAVMFAWMLVFCALCMAFMPWLIYLFAWGFKGNAQKMALLVALTQICFPYLLFMTLTALQGGVLNSLHRFTAAAAAPILLNLVLIASNVVAWVFDTGNTALTGKIYALGVTFSGLAQFTLLALACEKAGVPMLPAWPRLTPDVKRVIARALPGILSGGVMQINLLIATSLASAIPHANSYLYYADRLYQLPLGVIGVAIGVVLLPTLSRQLRSGERVAALATMNRALEFSLFLTLPAAAALIVIGDPILHTVFEHLAFKSGDTAAVAPALAAFALGLPAYSLTKVFQPGFYARGDTQTPMRFALISVAINVALSVGLSQAISYVGIALATSVSAWVNAALLYRRSRKLGHFRFDFTARRKLPRMALSTGVMSILLFDMAMGLHGWFKPGSGTLPGVLGLTLLVVAGMASYFIASHATGAWTFNELKAALGRSRKA